MCVECAKRKRTKAKTHGEKRSLGGERVDHDDTRMRMRTRHTESFVRERDWFGDTPDTP